MSRIAGIFPIGDTGEEFVVAEWVPDPDVVAAELFRLANETEDWAEPLAEARAAIMYDTEAHFDSQHDPMGKPWTALSPEYAKRKPDHANEILQLTGALKAAAIAEDNWFIGEREIVFKTEGLPFYGPYHQAGTAPAGVTQVLAKLRAGQEISREEAGLALSGFGRGNNLPQRMFIGLSDLAIAEVEEIFINWLNKRVDENIGRSGGLTPVTTTTTGLVGTLTNIPLFGGGVAVRGAGGRFIGRAQGS